MIPQAKHATVCFLQEMEEAVISFCDSFSDQDACAVLIILTHGNDSKVHGRDGPLEREKILNHLNYCSAMRDKPKVVVIQACRGGNLDVDLMSIPASSF